MTADDFEALITRRDALDRRLRLVSDIFDEEPTAALEQECMRVGAELAAVQAQLDAELTSPRAK